MVGRQSAHTPQLASLETVSRSHARIARGPAGQLELTDLGSSNHTYVNGRQLSAHEPLTLDPPCVLGFGQRVQLRLEVEA
jgi:pSer/pThr/pTyr-binding forkhead associated (FHA) protein